MGKWALLTITLVLASGLSLMIAPATTGALPQHPVDTSKTIDEFGEDVKIYLTDDTKKKKPPGKQGKPPPNKTPGEGEPPKKPGKPKKPKN